MESGHKDKTFSHDAIWAALDEMALGMSLSPSALAKMAGLDPTSFNVSKRFSRDGRPRWPSTESVAKVLSATGTPLEDFVMFLNTALELKSYPLHHDPASHAMALHGAGFEEAAEPFLWDQSVLPEGVVLLPCPAFIKEQSDVAYLALQSDVFAPYYHHGQQLLVSFKAELTKGCKILIADDNHALNVRIFQRETDKTVFCEAGHEASQHAKFRKHHIRFIARILFVSQ